MDELMCIQLMDRQSINIMPWALAVGDITKIPSDSSDTWFDSVENVSKSTKVEA